MNARTRPAEAPGHTPAPWAYNQNDGAIYFASGEVQPLIATVNLENVSDEQSDADGFLIAAAPDLLEACQAFVEYDQSDNTSDVAFMLKYADARRAIFAAIARATGAA